MSARRSGVNVARRAAWLVLAMMISRAVFAQDVPPSAWARAHDASSVTNSTRVSWLGAWSPLRPIADVARGEIRAPFGPGVLNAPAPITGAILLAGAPGAIARYLTPRLRGDTARLAKSLYNARPNPGAFIDHSMWCVVRPRRWPGWAGRQWVCAAWP